ncbi:hypothetical protein VK72_24875 [Paenibacillus polymyxa]|nr:hypothetical protein VK72_24875 [Paenibacillus polymyxa]
MYRNLRIALTIILVTILIGGCSSMSSKEKEETVKAATASGVKYIKSHYNSDFTLKKYEIEENTVHARIHLYGYIKGNNKDTIIISYDLDSKEVVNVTGPDWFIDSRIIDKNAPFS